MQVRAVLMVMNIKALIAEFLGPFALCFFGILSCVNAGQHGLVIPALCHGLVIAVLVSAFAAISGGHINPAVTFAMMATRKISMGNGLAYIVAQLLGGLAAAYMLMACGIGKTDIAIGTPAPAPETTALNAIMLEAVATFFFALVIFGTAVDKRAPKMGGLFIGFAITLDILAIGPMTGGAMNPARWLGPALVNPKMLADAGIYFVGPILGAVVAGLLYDKVLASDQQTAAAE